MLTTLSAASAQLGAAVNSAYETAAARGKRLSIDDLAEKLRGRGYDVRIRTALGGGGGGECLRNLRHHFLTLNMTGGVVVTSCMKDVVAGTSWRCNLLPPLGKVNAARFLAMAAPAADAM